MATILITGGTGLIGTALTNALIRKGYDVIILTRQLPIDNKQLKINYALWNVKEQTIDADAVKKTDCIIHLAGANVAEGRWTNKRKKEIIDSRVKSGELLVKALKEIQNKIKTVISASAIGYYGADHLKPNLFPKEEGSIIQPFIESDSRSNDFLGSVAQQWEAAIKPVIELKKRLVIFRTGIVLSNEGGAYKEFKKTLKFGIASILGNGKQIISWIHIDDLVRLYIEAVENENLQGVYNAAAPNLVSNKRLILEMAKQRNKFYVPVNIPSFILKIILGEMSIEVLKSTTVSSSKIEKQGFKFLFPTIEAAVKNLSPSRTSR